MDKDKKLVDSPSWEGLSMGESGSFSDWGGMLSKSLINFLLMGGSVFPPCSLASGHNMVGIMAVMRTSFKKTYASTPQSPQECCILCP